MNFYNVIFKSISIHFPLRKVIYTNYLKKIITLFAKGILIINKILLWLYLQKILKFNPIL